MDVVKNDAKVIRSWAIFDWANSAFALVISTAVFPPFFSEIAPDFIELFGFNVNSNSLYSYSNAAPFFLVAIMTPILSGIADSSGRRMQFLKIFTWTGAISCMLLYFFKDVDTVVFGLIFYIIASLGFTGGIVFYNSYLPDIATEDKFDNISAKGYAYGYIGSVIILIVILALIHYHEDLGITSATLPPRLGFVLVGLWWLYFAHIAFRNLPKDKYLSIGSGFIAKGYKEVKSVFDIVIRDRNIVKFLGSYFFYIAGVNVVLLLATLFAKEELTFSQTELILLVLLLQFLAMIGSYTFAYLSNIKGNKLALLVQLFIWVVVCLAAYLVESTAQFYIIAMFVGLVFGGIQSLSRSTYSKLLPESGLPQASYFSFYDALTKVAVVLGLVMYGVVNQITGSMRYSILSVGMLFIVGFVILTTAHLKETT